MTHPPKPLYCWNCGKALNDVLLPISRHANCASCFEVLRCCRMCLHYRDLDHTKCAEDRADPPVVKENANFCEFFRPARDGFNPGATKTSGVAKSKLDALFDVEDDEDLKGLIQDPLEDEPPKRSALDDLFDD